MWIQRNISPHVTRAFDQFSVVVLSGARQAGKTSLARRLLAKASYVSLDVPREAEAARHDFAQFLRRHPDPLVIDEVQYAPDLFRHIKTMVDQDKRPGRFFLTGSQDFALMSGITESLAGRCAVLTLPTLAIDEIEARPEIDLIECFCWRGSFPELWQRPDLDRELWMGSYVATYLERDVRNILNVGSLRDFDRFLRASAARAGQLLAYSELARDVGITPNTAKAWLSILQASQQVFLLEPYYRSAGKRIVKTPKLYFMDPGLLTYLLGFTTVQGMFESRMWGAIWENLVITEVRKHFLNQGRRQPLWFWRVAQGEEVDLMIEIGPQSFLAIECKTATEVDSRTLRGIAALRHAYGDSAVAAAAIVCRSPEAYSLEPENRAVAIPLAGADGLHPWIDSFISPTQIDPSPRPRG